MSEIVSTEFSFAAALARAAAELRAGRVVAIPTETVYGLAAHALDPRAVQEIYRVKQRPAANPLIVHISSLALARQCAGEWPGLADKLADAFWPGPLTMVLRKSPAIPDAVTASGRTVAIRWPRHPFVQALIDQCGFPLAAPSANRSGGVSPTTAEHVSRSLAGENILIIDGGPCQVGIESTVLDLTATPPRILRPGMVHAESLLAVTGELLVGFGDSEDVIRSPGQLGQHYAPRARLFVLAWVDDAELAQQLQARQCPPARTSIITHTRIPSTLGGFNVCVIPHDPEAFARAIYGELHRCDDGGSEFIVVEALPAEPEWAALRDRLARASLVSD